MTILAFDQATRTSGWSVYKDKELIAHGTFTFSDSNLGLRLWKIRQKVEELYRQYLPDKIIYEEFMRPQYEKGKKRIYINRINSSNSNIRGVWVNRSTSI